MTDRKPQPLTWMAKLVLALFVLLIIAGVAWHGLSIDAWNRMWRDLWDRPGGPMTFRFFLQPTMAAIAALHDGLLDARTGRSPYFWTLLTRSDSRSALLSEALVSTARIILLGLGMDLVYQMTMFGTFYPVEAVNIALALAVVPYLLLRGPIARIARRHVKPSSGSGS